MNGQLPIIVATDHPSLPTPPGPRIDIGNLFFHLVCVRSSSQCPSLMSVLEYPGVVDTRFEMLLLRSMVVMQYEWLGSIEHACPPQLI